jgi:ribosomal protein S18 acetylase RimI-like enzyme
MNTFHIRNAGGEAAALHSLYLAYVKSLPRSKQGLVAHTIPNQLLTHPGLVCFEDSSPTAALLWRITGEGVATAEFYGESRRATKEAVRGLLRGFLAATPLATARYFELWTPQNAKMLQVIREEGFESLQRQLLGITKPVTSPALWNQFRFHSLRNFRASGCNTIARFLQEGYAGTADGQFYEEYQKPETCGAYVTRVINSPLCDLRNSWLAWSPSANKLAGVALSYIWPRSSALYLEQLVVHPLFRGKGLGRALLSSVCGALAEGSIQRVIVTVSKDNHAGLALARSAGAEQMESEIAFVKKQPGAGTGSEVSMGRTGGVKSPAPSRSQPEPALT